MPLNARLSDIPGVSGSTYLELSGPFDAHAAANFSTFWQRQLEQDNVRYFIADLHGVDACSLEAVLSLRAFQHAVTTHVGALALVRPSDAVISAMRDAGVGSLFTIFLDYKRAYEFLRELRSRHRVKELRAKEGGTSPTASGSGSGSTGTMRHAQRPVLKTSYSLEQVVGHAVPTSPPSEPAVGSPTDSSAATAYRLRGYTGDGRTFRSGAEPSDPPSTTPVLLAIPDDRSLLPLRRVLVEVLESHGLPHTFVIPPPKQGAWEWLRESFEYARAFIGEFTLQPATREPVADVLVAATLARLYVDPSNIVLLSSSAASLPIFTDVPLVSYNTNRRGLDNLAPQLESVLVRTQAAYRGSSSTPRS